MSFLITGCAPKEPVKIGVIAGLSDRGSDFGESVRDGVLLAVEQHNQLGGIHGRNIELIVRDDGQNRDKAVAAAEELIALKVDAIVGPVTSSMAAVVIPLVDRAGVLLISPTSMATQFHGKDDMFFRVNRTTREAALDHAQVLYDRGSRKVGMVYDASNPAYSNDWVKEFSAAFASLGGGVTSTVPFESSSTPRFADVMEKVLSSEPDSLLFVASSLDTARLCQQARKQAPKLPLSSTEWAASGERLIEMGGDSVEGLLIAHAYNRDDIGAPYLGFRSAFKARFQREFGSFSLLAYDTANALVEALRKKERNETLKQALIKNGPYQGVQQPVLFDANGDATRRVYFTEIRDGRFIQIK